MCVCVWGEQCVVLDRVRFRDDLKGFREQTGIPQMSAAAFCHITVVLGILMA